MVVTWHHSSEREKFGVTLNAVGWIRFDQRAVAGFDASKNRCRAVVSTHRLRHGGRRFESTILRRHLRPCLLLLLIAGCGFAGCGFGETLAADEPTTLATPVAKVSFARDIRPILSHHCGSCHGPDEATREAGLRFDVRESAVKLRKNGLAPLVAGRPDRSTVIARIQSTDASEQMPPPEAKKPLTPRQKQLLHDWIAQGADYASHWAFVAPQPPDVPEPKNSAWARNPIDRFVLARLEALGRHPAVEAPREALLRRVTLDLTGLPPSLDELDAYLADPSPDAYEQAVDRLLDSPRHAERMAMHWLDVARYADTNGYNNDEERTMWPWRDWVIDAFGRNLPYDRFLTEQLAGDLLPGATLAQRVATGFNRNHVLTTEGGIIEEEYRVEYVADRVHTTATVFMGLSLQCARCHDHKFDPITQREYYQMFAGFNHLPDRGVDYNKGGFAPPFVKVPSVRQQADLEALASEKAALEQSLAALVAQAPELARKWEVALSPDERARLAKAGPLWHLRFDESAGAMAADAIDGNRRGTVHGQAKWTSGKVKGALEFDGQTWVDVGQIAAFDATDRFSIAVWVFPTSAEPCTVLSKIDESNAYRGYDLIFEGGKLASHLVDHWPDNGIKVITRDALSLNAWQHVILTYDGTRKGGGVKIYVDGKPQTLEVTNDNLAGTLVTDKPLHIGRRHESAPFKGQIDDVQFFGTELSADDVARVAAGQSVNHIADLLAIANPDRTDEQRASLEHFYLENVDAEHRWLKAALAELPGRQTAVEQGIPGVMVMAELPEPRVTHLLKRGQYDAPGEPVAFGVPAALPPLPPGAPANRLGLAMWLTDPAHPLTARVAVNRWWEMIFGTGLVETAEDFGVSGALPTHPELLDWLAVQFTAPRAAPPLSKGGQGGSGGAVSDAFGAENTRDATPPDPPLLRVGEAPVTGANAGFGWDVKALLRLIVTSATYRQTSNASPRDYELDSKNQLLSRGPRFRLAAEVVRDNALALGGLLVDRVGGPSVKPYQPEGLWEEVSVERREKYATDPGDGLYRRTMYTFWKRTCPPPALGMFDAPTRETCTIRRARTNTPLQALVLLNDPTYVEAARKMAERVLASADPTPTARIIYAFRLAVARPPHADEHAALTTLYDRALERFRNDRDSAVKLLAIGRSPANSEIDSAELAAWTIVCTTLLNLDETISKE